MSIDKAPIYRDWSFWAVMVSIIAIVLSQLPPIHLLLKKSQIDFELYPKISITHKVGNPNLQLHVLITNTGGSKIRIKNIKAFIERDGQQVATLPAQNYLRNPNNQSTALFTSISLNPDGEWGNIVNFLNFFGRSDEMTYRRLEAAMKEDLNKKSTNSEVGKNELIELSSETVSPFIEFFNKHYIWLPGEYKLVVNVLTDKESANISKSYRFTIFESQSNLLQAITEKFKYGGGIWWNPVDIPLEAIIEVKEA